MDWTPSLHILKEGYYSPFFKSLYEEYENDDYKIYFSRSLGSSSEESSDESVGRIIEIRALNNQRHRSSSGYLKLIDSLSYNKFDDSLCIPKEIPKFINKYSSMIEDQSITKRLTENMTESEIQEMLTIIKNVCLAKACEIHSDGFKGGFNACT